MKLFIDSLSLAIPLSKIQFHDGSPVGDEIMTPSQVLQAKGRISKESEVYLASEDDWVRVNNPRLAPAIKIPFSTDEDIGSTYYKYGKAITSGSIRDNTAIHEDCILISINSKMLKERYYEGVTRETLEDIHSIILAQNVIIVSLNDFKNGLVHDVDIAHDFYDGMDIQSVSSDFKRTVKLEHKTRFKSFNRGKTGFLCGKRGDSYPEFKLYDKLADMTTPTGKRDVVKRKLAYTAKYLSNAKHPTARLEVSFSNVKDMRNTGLLGKKDTNTLDTIVDTLSNDRASQAMSYRAKQYFNTTVISSKELNISSIEGNVPARCTRQKLEDAMHIHNKYRHALEAVLELELIRVHKDYKRWIRGYITCSHWTSTETEPNALHELLDSMLPA